MTRPLQSCLIAFLSASLSVPLVAAEPPLFDAHLHYNAEDAAIYPPQEIVRLLQANRVEGAFVTSRPPDLALSLHQQGPDLILPMLGVYRNASEKQRWVHDAELPDRVEQALASGIWRGVGELHIFASERHNPVFLRIVELATSHGLPLQMHCDPAVIDALFEHAPKAKVLWAHAGAYPFPPLLRDYLDRYPGLYVDLSVRDQRIAPRGELSPSWEWLLMEYSDRFLVGVDTYRTDRWGDYAGVVARIRHWLTQLPDDVAEAIAYRNAHSLFGLREGD